jgi:hypothetical protein
MIGVNRHEYHEVKVNHALTWPFEFFRFENGHVKLQARRADRRAQHPAEQRLVVVQKGLAHSQFKIK